MATSDIRQVAVIGTGTIGASWAAYLPGAGSDGRGKRSGAGSEGVSAPICRRSLADPRPEWEPPAAVPRGMPSASMPNQRRRWPARNSSRRMLPSVRRSNAGLLQRIDAVLPPSVVIASSSSGLLISELAGRLPPSRALRDRASVQPAASDAAGRGRRRRADHTRQHRAGDGGLCEPRQAADPHPARSQRPYRQPAAGGAMARGRPPRRARRRQRRRHRYRDQRGAGVALGADGPPLDIPSCRRGGRHRPFPRPVRRPDRKLVAGSR